MLVTAQSYLLIIYWYMKDLVNLNYWKYKFAVNKCNKNVNVPMYSHKIYQILPINTMSHWVLTHLKNTHQGEKHFNMALKSNLNWI